jgi:hypothetical protein
MYYPNFLTAKSQSFLLLKSASKVGAGSEETPGKQGSVYN